MDLVPSMVPPVNSSIEVTVIQSSFVDFKPPRQQDAVLFESSLECVEHYHYQDIAWLRDSLKPNGFAVITLATRNTEYLWGDFRLEGRGTLLPGLRGEIGPAFAAIGLKVIGIIPLVGA